LSAFNALTDLPLIVSYFYFRYLTAYKHTH
jgi:hypothetical protein